MAFNRYHYCNNNNDDSSFEDDDNILNDHDFDYTKNFRNGSTVSQQVITSDYDDDLYWDADLEDAASGRRVDSNRFPRPWLRRRDRNTIRSISARYNYGTNGTVNNNYGNYDDEDDDYYTVPATTHSTSTTATATRFTQHSNEFSRKRKRSLVDNCRF